MTKIVFMGTPAFSAPILRMLHEEGYNILAVVTQPDRPVGRKKVLTPPPVKEEALALGLPVIGIVASMVMTVGIVTYSFYDIAKQVRDNPGYVDELHDLFNNTLDMQQIPEAEEMKEYYNQYFEQLEDWAGQLQKNP